MDPLASTNLLSIDPGLLARGADASRPAGDLLNRQRGFAGIMARATREPASAEEQATRAAQDFVAIALVQPVLARMRAGNHAAPPFGPGPAEKQFAAIADAQVARQIVSKSHYPLVDQVARRLISHMHQGMEA